MPFATMNEIQPRPIKTNLGPAPITESPGDMSWSRPSEMSYYAVVEPNELFHEKMGLNGLGDDELRELDKLPKQLVAYLADEAQDPAFVRDYLVPALHTQNPYRTITRDISDAIYQYTVDPSGMGDLGKSFFKKVAKVVRKVHKAITPKFMQKIEGKIHAVERKVWKKYGNVIIGVAGAVLAPFTGGASIAAASVILAGKSMYDKKKAADAAKKAAKVEAGQLQAEADAQAAQVAAQVDQFYRDNQAWFLQYDMTPEKWAQLTLDQKIEFINAGAAGRLPAGSQTVPDQQPSAPITGTPPSSIPPGAINPIPINQGPTTGGAVIDRPSAPQPGYVPSTQGPQDGGAYQGGGPQYGPPPGDPGAAPQDAGAPATAADGAPAGDYELFVEGQSVGKYNNLTAATKDALANTTTGDRFEVMFNGKSTGLRIRTATSTVEAPPGQEDKVRMMTHEQVLEVVSNAGGGAPSSGGIPWGLIAIGAGGLFAVMGHK